MHSLFEEQITLESQQLDHYLEYFTDAFAEALTWYPKKKDYWVGLEEYLDRIRRAKETVDIPIIGSLNGVSAGGWLSYASEIEQAGTDGLVLFNRFYQPDLDLEALQVVPHLVLNTWYVSLMLAHRGQQR